MDNLFLEQFDKEIKYFKSNKLISWHPPASDEEILHAEKELDCRFSPQMRYFFNKFNGGKLLETWILGVQRFGVRKIKKEYNIVEKNNFLRSWYGWKPYWLSIGEDGFGNFYILDLNRKSIEGEYPIFWLDHEEVGSEDVPTEYAINYSNFLLNLVNEMKRIYTPYGELIR